MTQPLRKDMFADEQEHQQICFLFVDDETNILSSLRRLFRPLGYSIHTANSAKEGLRILEEQHVDLVISDMRMPEMDGAEFLTNVANRWPDTVRILLTGYADISKTIEAINAGRIYQYISKPWEDNDIKLCVQNALKQKLLERERDQLLALTKQQNEQLQELNASLENKVEVRTRELRKSMEMFENANKELKKSYLSSIKVFSNIIETRETKVIGHSRRVAEQARHLAIKAGMKEDEVQQVVFAGLLHNIGKIGLPDNLVNKPLYSLSTDERSQVYKHSVIGAGILIALDYLQEAAKMIRNQNELYDGSGYPDQLTAEKIPLGARIIRMVSDYDALLIGRFNTQRYTPEEAREYIRRQRGRRYDPKLVDLLLMELGVEKVSKPSHRTVRVRSNGLRAGMVLARDLSLMSGITLLTKGYTLDERLIQRIQNLEQSMGSDFEIYVLMQRH